MQICAIDNGYFNTKVKTEKQQFKFRSKIQEFNDEQINADSFEIFNKTYIVGDGKDTIEIKKVDNEIHKICTIASLSMLTNDMDLKLRMSRHPYFNYI